MKRSAISSASSSTSARNHRVALLPIPHNGRPHPQPLWCSHWPMAIADGNQPLIKLLCWIHEGAEVAPSYVHSSIVVLQQLILALTSPLPTVLRFIFGITIVCGIFNIKTACEHADWILELSRIVVRDIMYQHEYVVFLAAKRKPPDPILPCISAFSNTTTLKCTNVTTQLCNRSFTHLPTFPCYFHPLPPLLPPFQDMLEMWLWCLTLARNASPQMSSKHWPCFRHCGIDEIRQNSSQLGCACKQTARASYHREHHAVLWLDASNNRRIHRITTLNNISAIRTKR